MNIVKCIKLNMRRCQMNEVIKILPMTTLLSEFLKLSEQGWYIVGFKKEMIVLKFKEKDDVCR